jgi:transposase
MGRNRYVHRAKISEAKFRQFLRCFALDMEATKIAHLTRLNRNTVNRLVNAVRERIAEECAREAVESGVTPPDSASGDTSRFLRPHGAGQFADRVVFGWVTVEGRVHTRLVRSVTTSALGAPLSALLQWYPAASIGQAKNLGDSGGLRPAPIPDDSAGETVRQENRIRILDNFWGQAKLRLTKFKGLSPRTYHLHLNECEFRFNRRKEDLYRTLLNLVRQLPLF